VVTHYSI